LAFVVVKCFQNYLYFSYVELILINAKQKKTKKFLSGFGNENEIGSRRRRKFSGRKNRRALCRSGGSDSKTRFVLQFLGREKILNSNLEFCCFFGGRRKS
jgi:hypothetical protein